MDVPLPVVDGINRNQHLVVGTRCELDLEWQNRITNFFYSFVVCVLVSLFTNIPLRERDIGFVILKPLSGCLRNFMNPTTQNAGLEQNTDFTLQIVYLRLRTQFFFF